MYVNNLIGLPNSEIDDRLSLLKLTMIALQYPHLPPLPPLLPAHQQPRLPSLCLPEPGGGLHEERRGETGRGEARVWGGRGEGGRWHVATPTGCRNCVACDLCLSQLPALMQAVEVECAESK